jgi:arginase
VVVPYELGRLREGVGCGPEHLLEHGAEAALRSGGADVRTHLVELDDRFNASGSGDGDAAFELIRLVALEVRRARADDAFPVVLSGSCFAGVGVVAGLDEPAPGVVWFDAHADFNEPATSISGYIDGMGLAILTGGAWQAMLATVPGARPVPSSSVVLAGARDFDPPEEVRLAAAPIVHVTADRCVRRMPWSTPSPRSRRRSRGSTSISTSTSSTPRRRRSTSTARPTAPTPTSSTRSSPR